jgi:hypothetical protein
MTPAKIAAAVSGVKEGSSTTAGAAGVYGHVSLTACAPEPWLDSSDGIAQWWRPSLRQHTGTVASAAPAPKREDTRGRLNSNINDMASARRTASL